MITKMDALGVAGITGVAIAGVGEVMGLPYDQITQVMAGAAAGGSAIALDAANSSLASDNSPQSTTFADRIAAERATTSKAHSIG